MTTLLRHLATASSLLFLAAIGCRTAPSTADGKADLEARAEVALSKAKVADASLARMARDSAGQAVFPSVGKGAIGVGGAYGKGVLYERGAIVGYCDLTQATVGLQLGAQSYTEILVFQNADTLAAFRQGTFTFDAQATAVVVKSGTAANANYSRGVAVFTMDEAGLMFEAAVGGQKFSYQPK
jgi:lipid-binding SYLF domain-containing protein